jgi:hypothetical protein
MKRVINGKSSSDCYASQLADFLPESFSGHILWPDPKFTPEELGTTGPDAADAIEHFIELTKNLIT